MTFIEHHWGDLIGLLLVAGGVVVAKWLDRESGLMLLSSGLIALKLKHSQEGNANG